MAGKRRGELGTVLPHPPAVIPAKAGTQASARASRELDPSLRWDDTELVAGQLPHEPAHPTNLSPHLHPAISSPRPTTGGRSRRTDGGWMSRVMGVVPWRVGVVGNRPTGQVPSW